MDLSNQKKLVLKYFAFCTSDLFEISVCVYVTRILAPLSCWIRYPRKGLLHSCIRLGVFFFPQVPDMTSQSSKVGDFSSSTNQLE